LPGIEIAIAEVNGQAKNNNRTKRAGQLVLKKASFLFRAYLHEDERYKKCFIGDWYLSGDLAKRC
jgi:acetyl-CoA synthetase